MADPTGEANRDVLRLDFDRRRCEPVQKTNQPPQEANGEPRAVAPLRDRIETEPRSPARRTPGPKPLPGEGVRYHPNSTLTMVLAPSLTTSSFGRMSA
jgi:hypothetical protein